MRVFCLLLVLVGAPALVLANSDVPYTIFTFKRQLDTCSRQDQPFGTGTMKLRWAYSDEPPLTGGEAALAATPMSAHGQSLVKFRTQEDHWNAPSDASSFDLTLRGAVLSYEEAQRDHVKKPITAATIDRDDSSEGTSTDTAGSGALPQPQTSGQDDDHFLTFWKCAVVELPQDKTQPGWPQLIRYEPVFNPPEHAALVHHFLVYQCPNLDPKFSQSQGGCWNMSSPYFREIHGCIKSGEAMAAWGVGAGAFDFPPHVGYLLDESVSRFVVLEVHFTIPAAFLKERQTIVDSSGMRFWRTWQHRAHHAGIFLSGRGLSPGSSTIPANTPVASELSLCPPACTRKLIADQGIRVFGSMLHAHQYCRSASFHYERMNATTGQLELVLVSEDAHFRFDQQVFTRVEPEVVLRANDTLVTRCDFDTTTAPGRVRWGLSTEEEMCLALNWYYPRNASNKHLSTDCRHFLKDTGGQHAECAESREAILNESVDPDDGGTGNGGNTNTDDDADEQTHSTRIPTSIISRGRAVQGQEAGEHHDSPPAAPAAPAGQWMGAGGGGGKPLASAAKAPSAAGPRGVLPVWPCTSPLLKRLVPANHRTTPQPLEQEPHYPGAPVILDEAGRVSVWWRVNWTTHDLELTLRVQTRGWVALGWSAATIDDTHSDADPTTVDTFVGWVSAAGQVVASDRYGWWPATDAGDAGDAHAKQLVPPALDELQDLYDIAGGAFVLPGAKSVTDRVVLRTVLVLAVCVVGGALLVFLAMRFQTHLTALLLRLCPRGKGLGDGAFTNVEYARVRTSEKSFELEPWTDASAPAASSSSSTWHMQDTPGGSHYDSSVSTPSRVSSHGSRARARTPD